MGGRNGGRGPESQVGFLVERSRELQAATVGSDGMTQSASFRCLDREAAEADWTHFGLPKAGIPEWARFHPGRPVMRNQDRLPVGVLSLGGTGRLWLGILNIVFCRHPRDVRTLPNATRDAVEGAFDQQPSDLFRTVCEYCARTPAREMGSWTFTWSTPVLCQSCPARARALCVSRTVFAGI